MTQPYNPPRVMDTDPPPVSLQDAAQRVLDAHDDWARKCNFDRCGCDTCKLLRPAVAKATDTP